MFELKRFARAFTLGIGLAVALTLPALAQQSIKKQFQAQNYQSEIKWDALISPACDLKPGQEITLTLSAKLPGHWHVYSVQSFDSMSYRPTLLELDNGSSGLELAGPLTEVGKPVREWDDILEGYGVYFEHTVTFKQRFRITATQPILEAKLVYQACEFVKFNLCEFPELPINFDLASVGPCPGGETGSVAPAATGTEPQLAEADTPEKEPGDTQPDDTETPIDEASTLEDDSEAETLLGSPDASDGGNRSEALQLAAGEAAGAEDTNYWLAFILAFGGGFVALLTPCVFPMIPMTVSFFTKRSSSKVKGRRDAIVFSGTIVGLFTVIGFLTVIAFGPTALYNLSINPVVNLVLFAMLIVFALSFFGMFDITLPSSWSTKLDAMSERGGAAGMFFMATALVVASFSCTGPLIGGALATAASGGSSLGPLVVLLGFGMGFGIPFGVFAFFPSLLTSMPKSGGWLNSVKVFLGFIELGLALKFLSIADLRLNGSPEILPRDLFLVIWIILAFLLGLYLLGKIRLPHDTKLEKISVPRFLLASGSFMFALWLIPGLIGAPLGALAGYLPPQSRSDFNLLAAIKGEDGNSPICVEERLYANKLGEEAPQGFCMFYDLDEALAYAKKVNKPLFVDYTGHTCANCRQMERNVWPKSQVKELLTEDFVMVSLYADDDTPLENGPIIAPDGTSLAELDEYTKYLQLLKHNTTAQPLYAIYDHNMRDLTAKTVGYTPDVQAYVAFLEEGLKEYRTGGAVPSDAAVTQR